MDDILEKADSGGWVVTLCLAPPTLGDNTADADRLKNVLKKQIGADHLAIDLPLLKRLPRQLRDWNYRCRCICFKSRGQGELIDIFPPDDNTPSAGIAVDLGTTRVVMRLIDLSTGEALGETAFDNPQAAIGPDILERIHHAGRSGGLDALNRMIVGEIDSAADSLCKGAGFGRDRVYLMAVAGNTSMTHLFLGVDPHGIIREPYIPAINTPGLLRADELGLNLNSRARVFVFPNVGSYFGGDLIAGAVFAGFDTSERIAILVDVGTNAEVLLGNRDWMVACAGAAGPALEGGVSDIGMTAKPGVIDSVIIDPKTRDFHLTTIEGLPPKGICGSGMIDLAAQLFLSGMLDIRGRLSPDVRGGQLRDIDGMAHLVIVPESASATGQALTISQADIDSLIRSKAAMYTILETITQYVGVGFADIDTFYVAGTFGSFIRPRSAISIGMIPDLPQSTYHTLGNSSLGGAARLLIERGVVDRVAAIRDRITYLELNVNQDFMNRFSAAKFLPHTDATRFPSVRF